MPIFYTPGTPGTGESLTDKCIVLDLDETCVSTRGSINTLKELGILSNPGLLALRERCYYDRTNDGGDLGSGKLFKYWGVTRPHLKEFLVFCFAYFKVVAVWTAAKKEYADRIVKFIFQDIEQPHIVYTRDDCEDHDGTLTKPLRKMMEDPVMKKYMNFNNTFALDDRQTTFSYDNPDNGILIPEYDPGDRIDGLLADEPALLQLKHWLSTPEVKSCRDVRKLDKSKIFKTHVDTYVKRSKH